MKEDKHSPDYAQGTLTPLVCAHDGRTQSVHPIACSAALRVTLIVRQTNKMNSKKILCRVCKHETNHQFMSSHDRNYYEELSEYREDFTYSMWVCLGCDTAVLEEAFTSSGMHDQSGQIYSYTYFPPSNEATRNRLRFAHISAELDTVYKEVVDAYNNGHKVLTAIGVRALLERICVTEGIDDQISFKLAVKIKKLQEKNHIPDGIIEGLNQLKVIGDDAAHKLNIQDESTLSLCIDLIEALLGYLYETKFELQNKARQLASRNNKE